MRYLLVFILGLVTFPILKEAYSLEYRRAFLASTNKGFEGWNKDRKGWVRENHRLYFLYPFDLQINWTSACPWNEKDRNLLCEYMWSSHKTKGYDND